MWLHWGFSQSHRSSETEMVLHRCPGWRQGVWVLISLHREVIEYRLPLGGSRTLDKDNFCGKTQPWANSSQLSWQLEEWVSHSLKMDLDDGPHMQHIYPYSLQVTLLKPVQVSQPCPSLLRQKYGRLLKTQRWLCSFPSMCSVRAGFVLPLLSLSRKWALFTSNNKQPQPCFSSRDFLLISSASAKTCSKGD